MRAVQRSHSCMRMRDGGATALDMHSGSAALQADLHVPVVTCSCGSLTTCYVTK